MIYSEFVTTAVQKPVTKKLIPVEITEDIGNVPLDYIFEPDIEKLLKINDFNYSTKIIKSKITKFIHRYPSKKVAVWGAGHQALTLITLTGVYNNIKYIVDSAKFKQSKFAPGCNLKIVSPDIFKKDKIAAIIVMAAGFSDEVCATIRSFNNKISIVKLENNNLIKIA